MGLFDFFRRKKKAGKPGPEGEAEGLTKLEGVGLSEVDSPETRFTEEYREFLVSQGYIERSEPPSGEE